MRKHRQNPPITAIFLASQKDRPISKNTDAFLARIFGGPKTVLYGMILPAQKGELEILLYQIFLDLQKHFIHEPKTSIVLGAQKLRCFFQITEMFLADVFGRCFLSIWTIFLADLFGHTKSEITGIFLGQLSGQCFFDFWSKFLASQKVAVQGCFWLTFFRISNTAPELRLSAHFLLWWKA